MSENSTHKPERIIPLDLIGKIGAFVTKGVVKVANALTPSNK